MGVFQTNQVHGGSIRADDLSLQLNGATVKGMALQNTQFQFTQQLSQIYEIGSSNVYLIGGRAEGQATIGQIIGPGKSLLQLVDTLGDICDPSELRLDMQRNDCSRLGEALDAAYTLSDAVMTSIGASINAQDTMVNQQVSVKFMDLTLG